MINKMEKINTKKESRYLDFNEIEMSEQLLLCLVKSEMINFYTNKLTDFDLYSDPNAKKILELMENLAHGKYDKMIYKAIPDDFPFYNCYSANIVITDDLEDCGNLELKINLSLTRESKAENSWLHGLGLM